MKINLGCGTDYKLGWLNVDRFDAANPDLVFDLEKTPWPLKTDCAEFILMKRVLEHLGKDTNVFLAIMRELYRIARPDALIEIHVPHPLHSDFLREPTHARPILPDTFQGFDLEIATRWQAEGLPRTPLAKYIEVDFFTAQVELFPDPYWQARLDKGQTSVAEFRDIARSTNNALQWIRIVLQVRKPFRRGKSWAHIGAFCLERYHGMGDVLMLFGAAKAITEITGKPVYLQTDTKWQPLIAACPHVAGIVADADGLAVLQEEFRSRGGVHHVDCGMAKFGMTRRHQIDAYLKEIDLTARPEQKEIVLDTGAGEAEARKLLDELPRLRQGQRRVLLHPALSDPNRTWPAAKWDEAAKRLIGEGHQVIIIGATVAAVKGANPLPTATAFNAIDRLSPLGLVALMEQSDLLVTTDAGPVQLAAATKIAIVGIYSVASGKSRLPFRNGVAGWRAAVVAPTCSFYPCYNWICDAETLNRHGRRFPNLHAQWCIAPKLYECMTDQISVDDVLRACAKFLAPAPPRPAKSKAAKSAHP